MVSHPRYSDFININKNFKDVFNIEDDIDKELLWKRFIFTDSFKKILQDIDFIFNNDQKLNKKAIILTGKYGVGKSHATGVLSHLLWDNPDEIEDLLTRAKQDLEIPGNILFEFRKEKKYFPVILSARDSGEVNDSKSFEYRLQIGLEKALKKYGFYDKIAEKTEFEKYNLWLNNLCNDQDNNDLCKVIETRIIKHSDFSSVSELITALNERDTESIILIKSLFEKLNVPQPWHSDSLGYFDVVLSSLQRIDPSIAGIIIYWDEFTTVFNTAGKFNDANLLNQIQTWAEKASNNIILFLISHQSPEALRGRYELLEDGLAKISDRFVYPELRMDKITTFHLIANSLQITDSKKFNQFLQGHGLDSKKSNKLSSLYKDIFTDHCSDEKILKRTIPLHPYSVYVATKLVELVGSAERSIFQLIHSNEESQITYGTKIGFSKFLEMEPESNQIVWYTIDQVFDFFYTDLAEYSFDPVVEANVVKPFNAFSHYYEIVKKMGEEPLKIFKAVVLMEMLYAKTSDPVILTTKINIQNAFSFTSIEHSQTLLKSLVDNSILIEWEGETEGSIYKTRFGGFDDQELIKIKEELRKKIPFEEFLKQNREKTVQKFIESLIDTPRVTAGHAEISLLSVNQLSQNSVKIKQMEESGKLSCVIVIPQKIKDLDLARKQLGDLSQKVRDSIFILYEGNFEKRYEKWLDGKSLESLGHQRSNPSMIEQASQQISSEVTRFISDISRAVIFFRGKTVVKTNGIEKDIYPFIREIFSRGFDFLTFHEFWKPPKINSIEIFQNYGNSGGKKNIEENKKLFYVRKIPMLFQDEKENSLVDAKLILKDNEAYSKNSQFYEVVLLISNYIKEHNGQWISLRTMIDRLGLENPPYGLCGWIESLVISYAVADFYKEGRLEVRLGNQTASKDGTKIIEAINDIIKTPSKDQKIRYGNVYELKLAKKLLEVFYLSEEVKPSIPEIIFKIREKINTNYELPLWTIPHAYDKKPKEELENLISLLNKLIMDSNPDREISEIDSDRIVELITELENRHTKAIWSKYLSKNTIISGFKNYVNIHYPRLLITYNPIETLIIALKAQIQEDPWTWEEHKISEKLAFLVQHIDPPENPKNVQAYSNDEGAVVVWDLPSKDSPIPTNYEIERTENQSEFKLLAKMEGTATRYVDRSCKPGKSYLYKISAVNPAGKSIASNEAALKVLPPSPKINLIIKPHEESISISWEFPGEDCEIKLYRLFRGISKSEFSIILDNIQPNELSFEDFDVVKNEKYYYQIVTENSTGTQTKGIISGPHKIVELIPPAAPVNLKVINGKKQIQMSWEIPIHDKELVEGFNIYKSANSEKISLIYMARSDELSYSDPNVIPGVNYIYGISSKNSFGESEIIQSNQIRINFEIPQIIGIIKEKESQAWIKWNKLDKKYEIVSYEIFRGNRSDKLQLLSAVSSEVDEFFDNTVQAGHIYYYGVAARNIEGTLGDFNDTMTFVINLNVDTKKWEEETLSMAKSNIDLLFKQLRKIFAEIDNTQYSLTEKDRKIIESISRSLEDYSNEK